jgi:epoxyqueuosine reductase QueG
MDASRPRGAGIPLIPSSEELLSLAAGRGLVHAAAVAGPAPSLPYASFLVAALPYPLEGGRASPPPPMDEPPLGSLGAFARAHWYRELALALGRVASDLRAAGAWTAGDFRVLVNSRAAEKPLAAASGLGAYGRNGLIIARGAGSACVLGVLCLPFRAVGAPEPEPPALHEACAGCASCLEACPTGALGLGVGPDLSICIQAWASREGDIPAAVREGWGDRVYGCDACLRACPLRGGAEARMGSIRGELGGGISIPFILRTPPAELRAALRGSALGLSWLSAGILKRNAALALKAFPGSKIS